MTTFVVTRKSDGAEMTRYAATAPVEQIDDLAVPFVDFDHVALPDDPELPTDTRKFGGRRILTKLEFRELFPSAALKAIDRFEVKFEAVDYLTDDQKDDVRTAFNDYHEAKEVNLDDPRWIPGLGLYVALGMLTADAMGVVLNG